jgi:hypothetical protein
MIKTSTVAPPWDAVMEIWECPPSTQETSTAAPLGGDVRELGAPTVNAKNIDSGPPILRGGGSGLHLGSERCVVNLHGYDRQKSNSAHESHFPSTCSCYGLRPLVGLRGMGYSVQRYLGYGYCLVQGYVPSRPLVLSWQHQGGKIHMLRVQDQANQVTHSRPPI